MPRRAKVFWSKTARAWRSDVGPYGESGRRRAVYFRFAGDAKGKRLAEDELDEYLRQRDREEAAATMDAENPTVWAGIVRPYLEAVAAQVAKDEKGRRTLVSHSERLKRFMDFAPEAGPWAGVRLGDRPIKTVTDDDGVMMLDGLKAQQCGAWRVGGILRSVNAAFNWAATPTPGRVPRRILSHNPFFGLKPPKVSQRNRRLPTKGEAAAFFRAARKDIEPWEKIGQRCAGCVRAKRTGVKCRRSHNRRAVHDRVVLTLCRLQLHAGTRPSELCRATWGPTEQCPDAGWTAQAWRDPATGHWWGLLVVFGKTTRKTGELRRVAVPPMLARSIERIRGRGLHPTLIFPRLPRGGSGEWEVSGLDARVRRWRDAAGLDKHFVLYGMRHRMYSSAIHEGGLTGEQAGAVGGTGGDTVRKTYLQANNRAVFEHAKRISQADRDKPKG